MSALIADVAERVTQYNRADDVVAIGTILVVLIMILGYMVRDTWKRT